MATLTPKSPARAANQFALSAAAGGGDEFANTGKELLVINNGGGGSINLTLVTQVTADGEAVADKVIAIPAGEQHLIGPFPTGVYNDVNSKVQLSYSGVTSVTVGVVKPS